MGTRSWQGVIATGMALLLVLMVVTVTDAQAGQYFVWDAVIQGNVQGRQFQRQAFMYLTTACLY
jgi:low affinity Fe/Cu permease